MAARLSVARAAGIRTVFAAPGTEGIDGVRIVPVHHAKEALTWAGASRRHAEQAEAFGLQTSTDRRTATQNGAKRRSDLGF
jgi:hypothetical protein